MGVLLPLGALCILVSLRNQRGVVSARAGLPVLGPVCVSRRSGWSRFLFFRLGRHAVLPYFVDKEHPGHVLQDDLLGPLGYRLGVRATVVDVHDEDGQGGGGGYHCHRGDVILSCSGQSDIWLKIINSKVHSG